MELGQASGFRPNGGKGRRESLCFN
ncbi:hypothetical protein CCACVL1_07126 [Corchorus capsularis]|uniref:Uncharacterized protein n=1 Tax=Corchorus capsularis TaxID=210143 RepID=A0A1R3J9C1_COCAP|nr:hypothetical protein CCACVL1_07126 [Corchorus capsularis]